MLAAQRSSQMSQESKRTYTIRLPETIAARVEKQATSFRHRADHADSVTRRR